MQGIDILPAGRKNLICPREQAAEQRLKDNTKTIESYKEMVKKLEDVSTGYRSWNADVFAC